MMQIESEDDSKVLTTMSTLSPDSVPSSSFASSTQSQSPLIIFSTESFPSIPDNTLCTIPLTIGGIPPTTAVIDTGAFPNLIKYQYLLQLNLPISIHTNV